MYELYSESEYTSAHGGENVHYHYWTYVTDLQHKGNKTKIFIEQVREIAQDGVITRSSHKDNFNQTKCLCINGPRQGEEHAPYLMKRLGYLPYGRQDRGGNGPSSVLVWFPPETNNGQS